MGQAHLWVEQFPAWISVCVPGMTSSYILASSSMNSRRTKEDIARIPDDASPAPQRPAVVTSPASAIRERSSLTTEVRSQLPWPACASATNDCGDRLSRRRGAQAAPPGSFLEQLARLDPFGQHDIVSFARSVTRSDFRPANRCLRDITARTRRGYRRRS